MGNSKKNIKNILRTCFDNFVRYSGILRYYEYRMGTGLTILMYHRILPHEICAEYPLQSLIIPSEVFRAQMKMISESFRVLPVSEALNEIKLNKKNQKPLLSVTFDDGYYDNYEIAAPILDEFDLRATFFVTSGFVKHKCIQWYDKAAELWSSSDTDKDISKWMETLKQMSPEIREKQIEFLQSSLEEIPDYSLYRPMSVSQIQDLNRRGHEIASHTVNHPILTQLTVDELQVELQSSADQLMKWTGTEINGFCYPNGNHDVVVETELKKSGYRYACTVEEGINTVNTSPLRLLRVPVTIRRTMNKNMHDPLCFRAELCRVRSILRS